MIMVSLLNFKMRTCCLSIHYAAKFHKKKHKTVARRHLHARVPVLLGEDGEEAAPARPGRTGQHGGRHSGLGARLRGPHLR